jgi:hypothetical protein
MRFLNVHLTAVLVAVIVSLAFNPPASAGGHPNLKGRWESYTNLNKKIGPAEIRQKGDEPTFFNGLEKAVGKFTSKNTVEVADWKVTGTITADGRRINWSNNTYWMKKK